MTYDEQVELWIAGNSMCKEDTNECCPDFSCCDPSIKTPLEVKLVFQKAHLAGDRETVEKMLMGFLGGLVYTTSKLNDIKIGIIDHNVVPKVQ